MSPLLSCLFYKPLCMHWILWHMHSWYIEKSVQQSTLLSSDVSQWQNLSYSARISLAKLDWQWLALHCMFAGHSHKPKSRMRSTLLSLKVEIGHFVTYTHNESIDDDWCLHLRRCKAGDIFRSAHTQVLFYSFGIVTSLHSHMWACTALKTSKSCNCQL